MNRRNMLKTMGVATGTALAGSRAQAAEAGKATDSVGVLIDTTKCVGCRTCELACAEAHKERGLEAPEDVDLTVTRNTTEKQWTVVNQFETDKGPVFAKKQCMHCLQPACVSACLTKAMHKTPNGAVAWTGDKCMGCRYCMVSCPFDVPKFEYFSANPRIQKCELCWERLQEGQQPACVENCPTGALSFGPRAELLETARQRIYAEPDNYVHHIYGENEAGGTNVLYLASVPFDQIGMNMNVGTTAFPTYTREFLYAVPVVLTLVPPLLLALNRATRRGSTTEESTEKEGEA